MEATTQNSKQIQRSSDEKTVIPFTEAQLAGLTARQTQYFTEARNKMNYDLELAAQLDDRVQAAIKAGKTVKVAPDMTGFICE